MQYMFGTYRLDTHREELLEAGSVVRLDPQVFAVLAYLVQHRDRVVRRQELFEQLWADRFVSESALERCITVARRSVGDSGRSQQVIQTVRGRGYRFVASVEERPDEALPGEAWAASDDKGEPREAFGPGAIEMQEAERRQLTILACRLVGAPQPAVSFDPEVLVEALPDYHLIWAEVVRRFSGYPVENQNDSLALAYFGYPQAQEDDACRAVYAGLEIVEAMRAFQARRGREQRERFAVRVGVHTGLVVMSAGGSRDGRGPLALGQTPTIAAQAQGFAPPDTVAITLATMRLVEGYAVSQPLGTYLLDDAAEPQAVFQALRKRPVPSRFAVAAAKGLTPFVGREAELALLRQRWTQVKEGLGQVVVLSGEAGIGKSRLVHTFYDQLAGNEISRIECRCFPSARHHAFYPIVEHFQRRASFDIADLPDDKWRKFVALHEQLGLHQDEMTLLAASLFSLKSLPPQEVPVFSPYEQQQKIREALLTWLLHEAEQQPLCLLIEDVHWADSSTLGFLGLLIEHVPTAHLLMLLTFRSAFELPWEMRSYIARLDLSRLPHPQVDRIILGVTHGKSLPKDITEQLHAKTDGIPLFVEEMTRMVLESGLVKERDKAYELVDASARLMVPSTLHDSLVARLDGLGIGKRTAQLASVIGREFSYDLIRAVTNDDETALQQKLMRLVDAEILYQRGLCPRAVFVFKHALIQEAAYQSLLRGARRRCHRRIAQVLEEQFPDIREAQPELLAHHYTEAGLHRAAVDYWQRAASQAFARGAFFDAEAHVQRGLSATAQLTDASERHQCELVLQLRLAVVLRFTITYGADEVTQSLRRAQTLCEKIGDDSQLFSLIRSLWFSYIAQSQLATACELAQRLIDLASQQQQPTLIIEAHRDMGVSQLFLGEHATALHHFEFSKQMLASRHDAQRRSDNPIQSPSALAMIDSQGAEEPVLLSYLAWNQWLRGYPSQALETMDSALRMMQEEDLTRSSVRYGYGIQYFTSLSSATLHHWRRELNDTALQVEATFVIANQYGAPLLKPRALTLQGWAQAQRGQPEEGIALIQRGIVAYRAQGAVLTCTYMLGMLAESYGQARDIENALKTIAEALDLARSHDERWWEAELYRLRAELRLQREGPDITQATTDLQRALTAAREQKAKSLELRAATSFARLWQFQGKRQDAYGLLAPVYEWFTEGFDTADLKDAKALLNELGE